MLKRVEGAAFCQTRGVWQGRGARLAGDQPTQGWGGCDPVALQSWIEPGEHSRLAVAFPVGHPETAAAWAPPRSPGRRLASAAGSMTPGLPCREAGACGEPLDCLPAFSPRQEQESALQRVLQLPVVSGTCECFQKTYASTKEAHPLVASVCNAYEKGVQGASSLAAWSMEPVVRRLSTQCESSGHRQAATCLSVFLSESLLVCLLTCLCAFSAVRWCF